MNEAEKAEQAEYVAEAIDAPASLEEPLTDFDDSWPDDVPPLRFPSDDQAAESAATASAARDDSPR